MLATTIGAVAKNTARQPNASTRNPPRAGPATAPVPTMVIIRPMALPRSPGGNAPMMIAMPVPWVMAAPAPCKIRATIRTARSVEVPAAMDPAMITTEPIRYTSFAPIRSASRPMGSSRVMMVIANPIISHCTLGIGAWKCVAMVGSATPTLPWSTTDAKVPTAMAAKAYHLNRGLLANDAITVRKIPASPAESRTPSAAGSICHAPAERANHQ